MEKHTVTLEGAKLKHIADKNDTAQLVLFSLADRKRFRTVTDIDHMKNLLLRSGEKVNTDDYMNTWKALQDLGVGSVIYGRNGQPNRFKWNYSLCEIGQAAMNGTNVVVKELRPASKKTGEKRPIVTKKPPTKLEAVPTPDFEEVPAPKKAVMENVSSSNIIYIPLREDFIFNAKLPKLSEREADMICDAIRKCV